VEVAMSTMAYAVERKHHLLATVVWAVLFWSVAAVLVATAHQRIDSISPVACLAAKVLAIGVTAFAYIELTAREATIDHALLVGVAWVFLAIFAEVALASVGGHGWFELLGSPAKPLFRAALMAAWLVAPALFATARSAAD
jgi:hypothetical protein